jgi:hypothetical protein
MLSMIVERTESRSNAAAGGGAQPRFQRHASHSLILHERTTDGVFPFTEYQPRVR